MCTFSKKKELGFSLGKQVSFPGLCHVINTLIDETTSTNEMSDLSFSVYTKICCPSIGTPSNAKISQLQKLLLWFWVLGTMVNHKHKHKPPTKDRDASVFVIKYLMSSLLSSNLLQSQDTSSWSMIPTFSCKYSQPKLFK